MRYFKLVLRITTLLLFLIPTSWLSAQHLHVHSPDSLNGKPRYSLHLGGWIKLNGIYDFIGHPNTAALNPVEIPTGDITKRPTFTMDVYQTRVKIGSTLQTERFKEINTYIESDFYGNNGGGLRLRHAYADFNGRLAIGQYWSTASDDDVWANITDFDGPPTGVWVRQAQIRYTQPFSSDSHLSIAIETPNSDLNRLVQDTIVTTANQNVPDLIAHYKQKKEKYHFQLASILRNIRLETPEGTDHKVAFGGILSGSFLIAKKDKFQYQLLAGKGIASYLVSFGGKGFNVVNIPNEGLQTVPVYGGYLAYQHFWSTEFSSTLVAGGALVSNEWLDSIGNIFEGSYSSLNIYWHSVKRVNMAFEVQYATHRDLLDEFGDAIRLQFVMEYEF